jgi:hypothetical protein
MDPYLEAPALWPEFQHLLVLHLHTLLSVCLSDPYRAVLGVRPASATDPQRVGGFVEIFQKSDERLVTLLTVVSPSDKLTGAGRTAYQALWRAASGRGANRVEIDLVSQGEPTLEYSREGLPHWDYAVTVTRATHLDRFEIYTATLQKRLPRFRLPLAADDRDIVIDVQTAFNRCYVEGGYAGRIDYAQDPAVPLSEENRRWLDDTLQQGGRRAPPPTHEQVAAVAYSLWEQEGRPHGRDREHWQKALAQLRRPQEARTEGQR